MDNLKITGILYKIGETKQITEKFAKLEFVLETTDEKYPQKIQFELTQMNCDKMQYHKLNEKVTVYFNVRGREYQDKRTQEFRYFNSLNAWKIEKVGGMETVSEGTEPPKDTFSDDLPF